MLPEATLLLGADVTRLYRKLSAAGIQLDTLDLPLDSLASTLCQISLRLIRRAMEEAVPDAVLRGDAPFRLVYHIPAPKLYWHAIVNPRVLVQLRQRLADYDCYPFLAHVDTACNAGGMSVEIGASAPYAAWFQGHSLCALCDGVAATAIEIRRLEAGLQAARAQEST